MLLSVDGNIDAQKMKYWYFIHCISMWLFPHEYKSLNFHKCLLINEDVNRKEILSPTYKKSTFKITIIIHFRGQKWKKKLIFQIRPLAGTKVLLFKAHLRKEFSKRPLIMQQNKNWCLEPQLWLGHKSLERGQVNFYLA